MPIVSIVRYRRLDEILKNVHKIKNKDYNNVLSERRDWWKENISMEYKGYSDETYANS